MITPEVRAAEKEIDLFVQNLPVWKTERDVLLTKLMTVWRDGLEVLGLKAAHALTFNIPNGIEKSIAGEHLLATGVYQCLKWAMLFAPDKGSGSIDDKALIEIVMKTAAHYQILVDALKMGNHDRVGFAVEEKSKILTVYEGGDLTGADSELLRRTHLTTPFRSQTPFVEDSDQLTASWNAGQYREYWRWLKALCVDAEKETIMLPAGGILGPMQEVMKRPVVIEIPLPPANLETVQRDLTLTIDKVRGPLNWKIDGWHDSPLIKIKDQTFAVTLPLKTLEDIDDYMLRIAVLNDPVQYEKVSGLREDRMITTCKTAFEEEGWLFTPHYILSNPMREIDGYATRGTEILIVQLKSTLRPQSPWEVLKRNDDVLEGIRHTAEIVGRVGSPAKGVVITDGYAGDYVTWQESINKGVSVATLDDVTSIATSPVAAFSALAQRAGLDEVQVAADKNEREIKLGKWTIHLIDEPPPR